MNTELRNWIADFDRGAIVETVSMGGMGTGYEAAIQDCAIETMRSLVEEEVPEEDAKFAQIVTEIADKAAFKLDDKHGFSGAQVGAAKNIAAVFWKKTPEVGLEMMRAKDPTRILKMRKADDDSIEFIDYNREGKEL